MSTHDRSPIHPNLAEALEPDAADAAALDAIARRLAELGDGERVEGPPAGLFAAIEAELARGAELAPPTPALGEGSPNVVVPLAARRRRRLTALAVGAAAAAVAAVVGVAVWPEDEVEPVREEVALDALPDFEGAGGSATLVLAEDDRTIAVDLRDVEVPADHHLELWLLDEEVTQIIPLGELAGDEPHQVPEDVDLTTTPVVDVSIEPDDGDPAHSGISVVRGTITTS